MANPFAAIRGALRYGDDATRLGGRLLGRILGKTDDAARVAGGLSDDFARAVRQTVRRSEIPTGTTSPFTAQARTAAQRAVSATVPAAAKEYPIMGSFPARFIFGKPGRGLKAAAKTGAARGAGIGIGTGILGYMVGRMNGEQGPSAADAELESLNLGLASPYDLRLSRLGSAYDVAEQQLTAQEQALRKMLAESQAAELQQQQFLQNYGANTGRDIRAAYDTAAQEALRAAQEIERGGAMAREGITQEGAATAAALQALAEQPAQAGTGMFTGLVPVTGDVAEAPLAATNAANIAAEATQRGVNITRDDLRAAAAMAPMISEAYGRQVDSDTAMAIAMAQIAGQKERAQTQYQETARIGERRAEMALAMAEQEDALLAEALAAVAPDQLQLLLGRYQAMIASENGAAALAARGITSFSDYLEASVGRQTLDRLREIAGIEPRG